MKRKPNEDFAVPPPRKRPKPFLEGEKVAELDEESSRIIESESQFTAEFLYRMHDELDSTMQANADQRMKYQNEPNRFMESEAFLNELITKLGAISAYPELVPDFIQARLVRILVVLLEHPNEIIVGEVVEVLCQFFTLEIEDEEVYERHLRYCLDTAQDKQFFRLLLKNIRRLDENDVDQYETVYRTLRIVESLLDSSSQLADIIADETDLLRYLADRIMPNYVVEWRPIDDNKYISAEILVEMLQGSPQNCFTFGGLDGMEVLFEAAAVYKRVVPDNEDEKQFVSNLLNLMRIMLPHGQNRQVFNRLNGPKLTLEFIMEKNRYSRLALGVLADAFTEETCPLFITEGGLKYLFPILMRQGLKDKDQEAQTVIDENCLSILKCLLLNTSGINHDRVINKLREKNFEKLLRLVELRVEYSDVIGEDQPIKQQDYPALLKTGLTVIELVDQLILIVANQDSQVHDSIIQLRANLKEMLKSFGIAPQRIQAVVARHCAEQLAERDPYREHLQKILQNQFLPYFTAD